MSDTIFAVASGPPPAGVAIVRLSGPAAQPVAATLTGTLPPPRTMALRSLVRPDDGETLDSALVVAFPAPRSFTGEDVVEFHLHGSAAVLRAVLQWLSQQPGLRPAAAGEFTRRAFLSGRLDLVQAEALADLIAAETEEGRRAALMQAEGRLSRMVDAWRARLVELLAEVEAQLDFPDDVEAGPSLAAARAAPLRHEMRSALEAFEHREHGRSDPLVVIAGPPNAGKSSLFNAILGRDAAIVTTVAGTTRDLLEATMEWGGRRVRLADTAGVQDTEDPVEAEGVARALRARAQARLVLDLGGVELSEKVIPIRSRIDETGEEPGWRSGRAWVSGRTGAGVDTLVRIVAERLKTEQRADSPIHNLRQHNAILGVWSALEGVGDEPLELQAETLRSAGRGLALVTGAIGPEEVLNTVFSRMCIGK